MKRFISVLCACAVVLCTLPYALADNLPIPGDADGNGVVDTADATAILKYLIGEGTVNEYADCDGVPGIDTADATAILKYLIGEGKLAISADNYQSISGKNVLTAEQLSSFMVKKLGGNISAVKLNCSIYELATYYIEEGAAEGIRGDIAFMQACLETGWFKYGGDVKWTQNNYCGLGATGGGVPGESFDTPRLGVRAQIQHLKAYANSEPLNNAAVDPRFSYVSPRGKAEDLWTGLNGKWAVPGTTYGQTILGLYLEAKAADVVESYVALAKQKEEKPPVDNYQSISGKNVLTAEQLSSFMVKKLGGNVSAVKLNCSIYELAAYYIEEGAAEGIRGDIAFMQACLETGWFRYGGSVSWTQNNYCGLSGGAAFDSPRLGVRAHIQHLKAYANTDALVNAVVDPRFTYVSPRGKAEDKWTGLNGKWAIPGDGYGERIVALYEEGKAAAVVDSYVALSKIKVVVA